jgi:hypothetical protein
VKRHAYPSHQAWQVARREVIEAGHKQVAATLKMTPVAVEAAMQAIVRR